MAEVLATMKIMPESPEVDLDALKETIENAGFLVEDDKLIIQRKLSKEDYGLGDNGSFVFNDNADKCVILDKNK